MRRDQFEHLFVNNKNTARRGAAILRGASSDQAYPCSFRRIPLSMNRDLPAHSAPERRESFQTPLALGSRHGVLLRDVALGALEDQFELVRLEERIVADVQMQAE